MLIAALGIVIYVSFRFETSMGIASVLGLLHGTFYMIAFFSLTRLEVDLTYIAAILTIIGYSINDTIVTFDRIRENMVAKKKLKSVEDIAEIVNKGLRQTLTRSINTVLTVIVTVVALLIFGSESIRNFCNRIARWSIGRRLLFSLYLSTNLVRSKSKRIKEEWSNYNS